MDTVTFLIVAYVAALFWFNSENDRLPVIILLVLWAIWTPVFYFNFNPDPSVGWWPSIALGFILALITGLPTAFGAGLLLNLWEHSSRLCGFLQNVFKRFGPDR